MKTLFKWGYTLVLMFAFACSQPESELPADPKPVAVEQEKFSEFFHAYKAFIESLSEEKKNRILKYVNSSPEIDRTANQKTNVESICRCLSGQASCSAKADYTDCCICWDPETQIGACGKYYGVATCEVEERPTKTKNPDQKVSPSIIIYTNRLSDLFTFIEQNNIVKNPSELEQLKAMVDSM